LFVLAVFCFITALLLEVDFLGCLQVGGSKILPEQSLLTSGGIATATRIDGDWASGPCLSPA
jgi:hypothetical protein